MMIRLKSEDSGATSELQEQAIQLINQSITATSARKSDPEIDDEQNNHAVVKPGKKTIFVDTVEEGNHNYVSLSIKLNSTPLLLLSFFFCGQLKTLV